MPQGTILGPIRFSVMLNDIQAVDSHSSTLVKFADDLTYSVLVKGIQDQAPQEVQNILTWTQDNLMTINLTKTKEMVVKGKVEGPLPLSLLISNRKNFLSFWVFILHSNPTNWDKEIDTLISKAARRMHILRVCKKYGYSLDSLHHIFYSLIILIFSYGISV